MACNNTKCICTNCINDACACDASKECDCQPTQATCCCSK